MEVYRTIIDFPDYEISNLGNIRTLDGKKVRINAYLRPNGKRKELKCSLRKDGVLYSCNAGSLVAETFVPNPHQYDNYIYIDYDCFNIKANNIIWVDRYDFAVYCLRLKNKKPASQTREQQIKRLERNIKTASLFLEYLKNNDVAKINNIVLLYDEEIKAAIRQKTINIDEQNECYQSVVFEFMDKCRRNMIISSNLCGYLLGMVKTHFLNRSKRLRQVQLNENKSYNDYDY